MKNNVSEMAPFGHSASVDSLEVVFQDSFVGFRCYRSYNFADISF